jgi:cytochrome c oxidase subunit 2
MKRSAGAITLASLPLAGCQGWQSALDAHGPAARALADMFWIFTGVLGLVWVATMIAVWIAVRHKRPAPTGPMLALNPASERRMGIVVASFVGLTLVIVLGLTALSFGGQKALFSRTDGDITIKVVGHQWWWEFIYEDPNTNRTFTTANELHIPVGTRVLLKLESADVIHSFWVPNLTGKLDNIPGRQNQLVIQADREGVYRGQCAEFCGLQHAHMGLLVMADSKDTFERWRDAQVSSALPPDSPERQRGMELFVSKPCVMCHTVRGTDAGGRVGPDLTHVGSRRYIAAGTLETTRGNLAAWIVDPHGVKPGVNMPTVPLNPDEVQPIAAYLEGLK